MLNNFFFLESQYFLWKLQKTVWGAQVNDFLAHTVDVKRIFLVRETNSTSLE